MSRDGNINGRLKTRFDGIANADCVSCLFKNQKSRRDEFVTAAFLLGQVPKQLVSDGRMFVRRSSAVRFAGLAAMPLKTEWSPGIAPVE